MIQGDATCTRCHSEQPRVMRTEVKIEDSHRVCDGIHERAEIFLVQKSVKKELNLQALIIQPIKRDHTNPGLTVCCSPRVLRDDTSKDVAGCGLGRFFISIQLWAELGWDLSSCESC
jgi:hypothetical protein